MAALFFLFRFEFEYGASAVGAAGGRGVVRPGQPAVALEQLDFFERFVGASASAGCARSAFAWNGHSVCIVP